MPEINIVNRNRVEAELRKGVLLYHIMDSVDYSAGVRDEAKKMFNENVKSLKITEEASR